MNMLAFGIGNLAGPDLFIVLLIVLVLFGAKKLPGLARGLGESMNEFRKARQELDDQQHSGGTQSTQPALSQQVPSTRGAQQVNPAPM
jgi:sec-independent protein translocase protein TatA